jgi:ferrous iron transport protein B
LIKNEPRALNERHQIKIGLAGNPNSGKTSIFNGLTGAHQKVGNFPGVTVEKRVGYKKYGKYDIQFVDLPGTYSLAAYSLDEKVAREFIINERPDLIINIVDSCALERSLYLTLQLMEMEVDLVVALNMWDEAVEAGLDILTSKLSQLLGAPVVKTIGSRGQGVDKLLQTAINLIEKEHHPEKVSGRRKHRQHERRRRKRMHRHPPVSYGPRIDDVMIGLTDEVRRCKGCSACGNPRWLAIKLLEGDQEIQTRCIADVSASKELTARLKESVDHIKATTNEDPEAVITEGRYGYAAGIVREVMKRPFADRMQQSNHIDYLLTHKFFGYPIFLAIMWLIFQATFTLGQYPADWIDLGVGWLQTQMTVLIPEGIIARLIIDGIIGGVGSVIIFLPNIVILFMGVAILEDSGYMARAAFLMDRLMHYLGLHGKSFIPMLMGFGCNVPAIMATRTLESHRDRILTILIIPFMSCSARLPVYVLFAGAFFGTAAGNVIFSIYLLGIAIAIVAARLLAKTILRGESIPFVMELPPYRWPTWKSVAIHMWERSKIYLKKMGGVILIASIILWALGYFPQKTEYSRDYEQAISGLKTSSDASAAEQIQQLEQARAAEELEYTFIGHLGYIVMPVVEPLGFNWQMGVSLLTGFVAKEVVVSSMGVLYSLGEDKNEESETLIKTLQSPESGVNGLAAYAFMVFVLLYTPCIVAVITVKREIGWRWMLFSVFFQLVLAWVMAFIIFQGGILIGL